MNSTTVTSIERFAFDGPLHVALVVLAAGGLVWLIYWSLRRERDILGPRCTWLFGALRLAALLLALWMLLGPSLIRSQNTKTRKSVAILVDVSGSMYAVDPPGDASDARWTLAAADAPASATANADRALAAAALAEHRLAAATSAIKLQKPEQEALEQAAAAHDALERAGSNLEGVLAQLARERGSDGRQDILDKAARVQQILAGPDFERLAKLAAGFRRGQDSFPSGWRESLADLQHQTAGARRRLAQLAQQLGPAGEESAGDTPAPASNRARDASRIDRVAGFLSAIQESSLAPLEGKVEIQHALFDRSVTPLGSGPSPVARLREIAAKPPAAQPPAARPTGIKSEEVPASPAAPATDITAALEQLRRVKQEQPLAAVFLFTDAAHNAADSRDPRAVAAELSGTPVYVVPIGASRRPRDLDLKEVSAPGVVMKDDDVVIEATLQAFDCEGEIVQVELLHEGAVVQTRELQIDGPIAMPRVRFNTQLTEVGLERFQVRAIPLEGEASEENNFDHFEVNVTRNQIKVLLADELPRWEYRYLAQLFRRDAKVQCDELLFRPRTVATGRREATQAFPTAADDWDQYDVVLLGDVSSQNLSIDAQQSLVEFVRARGGTLVIVAGSEHMPQAYVNQPLEDLLPVTKLDEPATGSAEGYAFHVTDDGWRHDALMIADTQDSTRIAWDFISSNSPVHWLSEYRKPVATARTLIAAAPRTPGPGSDALQNALLCWQPAGRGRVVYLASPETYRLRYLRGDRLHYRFWGQLLRWAIASDLDLGTERVSIRTDRPVYRHGEPVSVVVRLADEAGLPVKQAEIQAVATSADESRAAVTLHADDQVPGRYVGSFDRLPTGIYRVEPTGPEVGRVLQAAEALQPNTPPATSAVASFTVRMPPERELLDTRSDRALAQQIAEASGGQLLPPTAVAEVLSLTNLEPIVAEKTETLPLWVQWKYLWIVFGCLFTEWSVRKYLGLS